MELTTFAINDGYAEAVLRGYRSSFLNEQHYNQIKNLKSLQDLVHYLDNETDYKDTFASDGTSNENIQIPLLRQKLRQCIADQFKYLAAQTTGVLSEFLALIQQRYMLDNTVNMIEGIKQKQNKDILIAASDPLGIFPELKNISVLDGDDYTGLYKDVLVDTPIGHYFMKFLEAEIMANPGEHRTAQDIAIIFKEMKPEHIRNSLKKMWIQNFYEFCSTKLNGVSTEMLDDLLKFEADWKTLQVIYNSIGNKEFSSDDKLRRNRTQLFPNFGYLYELRKELLVVKDLESLKEKAKAEYYRDLLRDVPDPMKRDEFQFTTKTIDDIQLEAESKKYAYAFDQGAQYAVFYAYLKLKEQEIRNITWAAEMIARKLPSNHEAWKKIVIPFENLKLK